MMKTWGKFFKRSSLEAKALEDDFESDVTDDERQRQRWQEHLNRRATIAEAPGTESEEFEEAVENEFEYVSEYSVDFPSDASIIDAYKERKYPTDLRYYVDNEFEDFKKKADRDGFEYETGTGRPYKGKSVTYEDQNKRKKSLATMKLPNVGNTIDDFESRNRRKSCVAQSNLGRKMTNKQRFATWNTEASSSKPRKYTRKRRRARDLSQDDSDDDNKYTVNLTMEDLNTIIKRNINSAVKTIVSAANKDGGRLIRNTLSPSESFSTETETFFSGSSSHSTEIPPGLLQKQIKAQLDRDKLKGAATHGGRRKSMVAQIADLQENVIKISEQMKQDGPKVSTPEATQFCSQQHQQQQLQPQHNMIQQTIPQQTLAQQHSIQPNPLVASAQPPIPPPPPPPPPPPATPIPQVTFSLPPTTQTMPDGLSPMAAHQNPYRRQSICPGMNPYGDLGSSGLFGMDANPFSFNNEIAGMASRLQNRRHTLASIDNDTLLSGLNSSMDQKLEKFTHALEKMKKKHSSSDSSVDSSSSSSSRSSRRDKKSKKKTARKKGRKKSKEDDSKIKSDPLPVTNVLAPVLSISDQIAALSKKKTPLEPGQIQMSTCARSCLILTNILFLCLGGGTVALGVWMMVDPNIDSYFTILDVDRTSPSFTNICYALMTVGGFVSMVAFMGCCGGMQSSKCLLTLFLVLVVVITLLEGGLGLMVFINLDSPTAIPILSALLSKLEDSLKTKLQYSLVYNYLPDTMVGSTWDKIQIHLECCGAEGPDDYKASAWKNDTTNLLTLPDSCCKLVSKDAEVPEPSNRLLCQALAIGFFHDEGCYEKLIVWFHTNSKYIIGAAGSVLALEVFSFIFAFIICQKAQQAERKEKEKQNINKINTVS